MSRYSISIGNLTAAAVREDITQALESCATHHSSGSTEPPSIKANMTWYDEGNNIFKIRNEANDAWINLFYLDQSNDKIHLLDDTEVTNTSGTQVGLLGGQSTSTWTTGTGTIESLISPANVIAAVKSVSLGWGQTWQDVSASRAANTAYQNTTGKPIMISVAWGLSTYAEIQISSDGTNYVVCSSTNWSSDNHDVASFIVPDDHYYKLGGTGTITINRWVELR